MERSFFRRESGSFTIDAVLATNTSGDVFVESATLYRNGEQILLVDTDGYENFLIVCSSLSRNKFILQVDVDAKRESE